MSLEQSPLLVLWSLYIFSVCGCVCVCVSWMGSVNSTGEKHFCVATNQSPSQFVCVCVCVCESVNTRWCFVIRSVHWRACTYITFLFLPTNQKGRAHMCTLNIWFCVGGRNCSFLSSAIIYRQKIASNIQAHAGQFSSSFLPQSEELILLYQLRGWKCYRFRYCIMMWFLCLRKH